MSSVTCSKCGITKPTTDFYPDNNGRVGCKKRCKSCDLEYGKEYRLRPMVKEMRGKKLIEWRKNNAREFRKKNSAYHAALKFLCLSEYSDTDPPTCQHPGCSISDIDMLTIDHINNDGAAHRKTSGATSTYLWLKKNGFPPGFRTLCMNHNFKKGLEYRRSLGLSGE